MFENLIYGFHVAFLPNNLLFCAIGVLVGTLVGVLPGIGPIGAMALLLPATFKATPAASLIMLAGIVQRYRTYACRSTPRQGVSSVWSP